MEHELYFDLLKRVISAEKRIETLEADIARLLEDKQAAAPALETVEHKISTRQAALSSVSNQLEGALPGFHLIGSGQQGKNRLQMVDPNGETYNLLLSSSKNYVSSKNGRFQSWNTISKVALEDNDYFLMCCEGEESQFFTFIFSKVELMSLCRLKDPDHEGKFRFRLFGDTSGRFWDENPQDAVSTPLEVTQYLENWGALRQAPSSPPYRVL